MKLVILTGVLLVVNDRKTPPDPLFEVRFACKVMASELILKQNMIKISRENFFIRMKLILDKTNFSTKYFQYRK